MNVSGEHLAGTLNGAFAGSPVVFRSLSLFVDQEGCHILSRCQQYLEQFRKC
jgi:hypothetical protein